MGRPSLAPGRYFRLLLIGYFEGLDSERAIAWRAADFFAPRQFLYLELVQTPSDHSTISRTRRLIDVETHREVFTWILRELAEAGLVNGKTLGIDALRLKPMRRCAVLCDVTAARATRNSHQACAGLGHRDAHVARTWRALIANERNKGSNDDRTHPHDPDAKITKMKDGRTHWRTKRSTRSIWRQAPWWV